MFPIPEVKFRQIFSTNLFCFCPRADTLYKFTVHCYIVRLNDGIYNVSSLYCQLIGGLENPVESPSLLVFYIFGILFWSHNS
ncbi:hypothetical protein GDO81_003197 [Engystomops pustulosus]|uniref:Uncharacterized protein n=1 Tax=Engystomops pustulosus TaxID=76066 RepID=A0AAV6ZUP8_ENGPU|nr:hypothetical protein GDO81_003197 [Engystomops pustulosus]